MCRYVCDFLVNLSPHDVRSTLKKLVEGCGLETIYDIEDYFMAREIPGRVSYAKLVTAEVLIDVTTATQSSVKLSFVVKNEELPLNHHNHCRQVFDLLRSTITQNYDWQPISNLRSSDTAVTAMSDTKSAPTLSAMMN